MKRKQSILLLFLGLIAVVCGLTVWLIYREHRQERLNHDLIAAVKRNDTKAVVSLLNQGSDVNCHDEPYKPLLWWKMLQGRLHGAKPKPSTAPTPLLLALQVHFEFGTSVSLPENLPLITALLDHKADVNARDESGATALLYALLDDKKATVHLLLKYGADMRPNREGYAPLVAATNTFADNTEILSDMLRRGADVNQHDWDGNTALCLAVYAQNIENVRLLLFYHASVTVLGRYGNTPLSLAKSAMIIPQRGQIIRLLKQAGARE